MVVDRFYRSAGGRGRRSRKAERSQPEACATSMRCLTWSMDFRHSIDSFGRRRFLIGALASGASRVFAATEFWNAKDPSSWTDEEIAAITSRSPWARLAVASPKEKEGDDPVEAANGPAVGGRGGRGGLRSASVTVTVRWESAQPVLDALKATLPPEFLGHYVVSVTNLPFAGSRRGGRSQTDPDDTLERLQNGATLQAKGRDAAEAGICRRNRIGAFLFGFSKDYLMLTPRDRDIVFKLDTGQFTVTAKFDGKEMMYHGKLAV